MKKNQVFPSNYLKADDLVGDDGNNITVDLTIKGVKDLDYGDGKKGRGAMFVETDKVLGVNATNWDAIEKISGEDDDDNWTGTKVQLYRTVVEFKGKNVPAIRVRPPGGWDNFSGPAKKAAVPASDTEVPF